MRGLVPGLRSAAPLAPQLPGVLQEDEFLQQFLRAFDDSLAPVLTSLDGLVAYFDPRLAPEDFVDMLAEWVGLRLDDEWPVDQRRELVVSAAALHARRGTVGGVADAVRLAVRGVVTVNVWDTGGASWSATPGGALPGVASPGLRVTVTERRGGDVNPGSLSTVISAVTPAHVPHVVEIRLAEAGAEETP
jgi:phage tail-like protein